MYTSKQFIFLISIFGSKERISNPNSWSRFLPQKIQPRLHCSCDHGKTKPLSFGQNKTAVGSKSPDRPLFFRVYEQNVANKNHTNHTNHASSNLPIYKKCPAKKFSHQPSKNSGHQDDVKQQKRPTMKRNTKTHWVSPGVRNVGRGSSGVATTLRCENVGPPKMPGFFGKRKHGKFKCFNGCIQAQLATWLCLLFCWQRRRAHMVCFPCFTCSTTNNTIPVKTVIS